MEIETLKDLKNVLSAIPDIELEQFVIGVDLDNDGDVKLLAVSSKTYIELSDKHQEVVTVLERYFGNIVYWGNKSFEQTIDDEWNDNPDGWTITSKARV